MSRLARVVVPGLPHHVTQRGNRRQVVFFSDDDRREYLRILREQTRRFGVDIWSYCLMENHVHLIAVPGSEDALAHGIGETHRRYTRYINFREGWRGYLWQGRFNSVVLDTPHLYAALRYVERNPVRAKLVARAEDYPWSSAKTHVFGDPDPVLTRHFVRDAIPDWGNFLALEDPPETLRALRQASAVGRPLGEAAFLRHCETFTHRVLQARRPGRKRKAPKK